ncbi:MAG: hypothetical protein AAFR61_09930 [Bacteroidota bacterium]
MNKITLSLLLTLVCAQTFAQHRTWAYVQTQDKPVKGVLLDASESDILILPKKAAEEQAPLTYAIADLEKLQFRRKGRIIKGIAAGAGIGFAAGFLVGFAMGDDPPCRPNEWCLFRMSASDKGLFIGVPAIIPGMILGGLIGSTRITFDIGGKKDRYAKVRKEVQVFRK